MIIAWATTQQTSQCGKMIIGQMIAQWTILGAAVDHMFMRVVVGVPFSHLELRGAGRRPCRPHTYAGAS
jgi:hypothetical protein